MIKRDKADRVTKARVQHKELKAIPRNLPLQDLAAFRALKGAELIFKVKVGKTREKYEKSGCCFHCV